MHEVPGNAARYRTGLAVRRSVLGDRHVDQAKVAATDFDQPFQELITEAAWG
ncbi:MAG: 4-carboxymuconolactone decarboxylase, partial [Mesorhizobium sp.]